MQADGGDHGDDGQDLSGHGPRDKDTQEKVPHTLKCRNQKIIGVLGIENPILIIEKCTHKSNSLTPYDCKKCWNVYKTATSQLIEEGRAYIEQKFVYCEHGKIKRFCKKCTSSIQTEAKKVQNPLDKVFQDKIPQDKDLQTQVQQNSGTHKRKIAAVTEKTCPVKIITKCTHAENPRRFYFCKNCWETYKTEAAKLDDTGIPYLPQKFAFCEHGRQKSSCGDCKDNTSRCKHNRQKSRCVDCNGSGICIHKRILRYCQVCYQDSLCKHAMKRLLCKHCGDGLICMHDKETLKCKDCAEEHWKCVALFEAKGLPSPVRNFAICRHGETDCQICEKVQHCEHGKIKETCKECAKKHDKQIKKRRVKICTLVDPEADVDSKAAGDASHPSSGDPSTQLCKLCNSELSLDFLIDPESGETLKICQFCHEEGKSVMGGEADEPAFDDCIHCYQCDRNLPFSNFGLVPDFISKDFTYCNECIEVLEHRPLFPCPWGCGKYVSMGESGPMCDKCTRVDQGSIAGEDL